MGDSGPIRVTEGRGQDIDLPRVHQALLSGLNRVADLCDRYEIEYWIDSGTLLGAVRHGGFIPWDDDVDLCMTRANVERFVAVAKTQLQPEYTVVTPADDRAVGVDIKIYVNGSHVVDPEFERLGIPPVAHDGLYIDIMVADPLAHNRWLRRFERSVAWLERTHPRAGYLARSGSLSTRRRMRWRLASWVPDRVVASAGRVLDHVMKRRRLNMVGVGPAALFNGYAVTGSAVFPLGRCQFADREFPAPADTHAYLLGLYGQGYMKLPPVEERVVHAERIWFDD